jgi:hypothetical protein
LTKYNKKTTKNHVQDRWLLGQVENLGPPKYDPGVSTTVTTITVFLSQ